MKRIVFLPVVLFVILVFLTGCKEIAEKGLVVFQGTNDSLQNESTDAGDVNASVEDTKPVAEATNAPLAVKEFVVSDSAITPSEMKAGTEETVTFRVEGQKRHKIACYAGPKRVVASEDLHNGDKFTYKFGSKGRYSCIDFIYGMRANVEVGSDIGSLTGRAIDVKFMEEQMFIIGPALLIAVLAFIAYFSGKKRH